MNIKYKEKYKLQNKAKFFHVEWVIPNLQTLPSIMVRNPL